MRHLRAWLLRLRGIFKKQESDRELAAEFESHLEMHVEDNLRAGMSAEEARRKALIQLGGESVKENYRERAGLPWLETILQDVHYSLRTMRRNPGFTLLVVFLVALGVGINTAVFSVVYGVMLRPLPFDSPGRLFAVYSSQPRQNQTHIDFSGPDFVDFRDQNRSFEQIATVLPYFSETMVGEGEPQVLVCTAISPEFFPMLGVRPLLGRLYTPEEYHRDGSVVVLSYDFWQRQFGGDPNVLNRVIHIGDASETIIGVMPPLPDIYPRTEIWAQLIPDFQFMKWRGNRFLDVVGNLKPGISARQAEEDLTAILRRAPETPVDMQVDLVPLKKELVGNVGPILSVLMSAVGLVLFIACMNVATLLLARSQTRKAEIALRISVGASNRRLLQQLLTENLILALVGGAVGILLARAGMKLIVVAGASQLPRTHNVTMSLSLLGFTLLIACLTSLIFGLAPSRALMRTNLDSALRSGRSDAGSWRKSHRGLLIVGEVSMSVILLAGSGLLLRTLSNLLHQDLGFQPDHLMTAYLRLTDGGFATPYQLNFYRRLLTEVPAISGVKAMGVADCTPGLFAETATLEMADRPADTNNKPAASGCWISADYFRATGTLLRRGRFFDQRDISTSPLVVIINEALARRYWPNQDPLGKRINVSYTGPGRRSDGQTRWREIVGVVENVKQHGLDENADPALYLPFYQDETGHIYRSMHLYIRTSTDPAQITGMIRNTLRNIEPNLPVTIRKMDDVLAQSVGPRNFTLLLFSSFALLAALLAGFGIYGVVAYSVNRRTREIGLRMALGADRSQVLILILAEVLVPVLTGLGVGSVLAIIGSKLAGGVLYRVPSADPVVLLSTAAIMLLIAAMAALVPACRAASTNPVGALRSE
ncbi:MAG TPA: ABC transporter permease [Alphaproteobacteria bacterium]|nr:ABC transporter permease [Alphaproteobacteria bacterium]